MHDAEIAEMADIPYQTVIEMLLYVMLSSTRPGKAYKRCQRRNIQKVKRQLQRAQR